MITTVEDVKMEDQILKLYSSQSLVSLLFKERGRGGGGGGGEEREREGEGGMGGGAQGEQGGRVKGDRHVLTRGICHVSAVDNCKNGQSFAQSHSNETS